MDGYITGSLGTNKEESLLFCGRRCSTSSLKYNGGHEIRGKTPGRKEDNSRQEETGDQGVEDLCISDAPKYKTRTDLWVRHSPFRVDCIMNCSCRMTIILFVTKD